MDPLYWVISVWGEMQMRVFKCQGCRRLSQPVGSLLHRGASTAAPPPPAHMPPLPPTNRPPNPHTHPPTDPDIAALWRLVLSAISYVVATAGFIGSGRWVVVVGSRFAQSEYTSNTWSNTKSFSLRCRAFESFDFRLSDTFWRSLRSVVFLFVALYFSLSINSFLFNFPLTARRTLLIFKIFKQVCYQQPYKQQSNIKSEEPQCNVKQLIKYINRYRSYRILS